MEGSGTTRRIRDGTIRLNSDGIIRLENGSDLLWQRVETSSSVHILT